MLVANEGFLASHAIVLRNDARGRVTSATQTIFYSSKALETGRKVTTMLLRGTPGHAIVNCRSKLHLLGVLKRPITHLEEKIMPNKNKAS